MASQTLLTLTMRQMEGISEREITALPSFTLISYSDIKEFANTYLLGCLLTFLSLWKWGRGTEDRLWPHASQVTIVTTVLHTPRMSLVLCRQWHNKYGLAAIHKLIQRTISSLWQFLLLTGIRIMISIIIMSILSSSGVKRPDDVTITQHPEMVISHRVHLVWY